MSHTLAPLLYAPRLWSLLPLLLSSLLLAGCTRATPPPSSSRCFFTTIPPLEALLAPVVGTRAVLHGILEGGASPHTHALRPSDLRMANDCLALLYGAPELDGWATDLGARRTLSILDLLPTDFRLPMPELDVESTDPHFWTDPLAVQAILPALADTLCALDPGGCAVYQQNATSFGRQLDSLHHEIGLQLAPFRGTPLLLSHPFFQYFLNRYGLTLTGVIEPLPGKEPSPKDLQQIIARAREANVVGIYTLPQLPPRSAQVVAESAALPLHQLDPIGGVPGRMTYTDLLRYNARILAETLP